MEAAGKIERPTNRSIILHVPMGSAPFETDKGEPTSATSPTASRTTPGWRCGAIAKS
jgi:hypothetical protein